MNRATVRILHDGLKTHTKVIPLALPDIVGPAMSQPLLFSAPKLFDDGTSSVGQSAPTPTPLTLGKANKAVVLAWHVSDAFPSRASCSGSHVELQYQNRSL